MVETPATGANKRHSIAADGRWSHRRRRIDVVPGGARRQPGIHLQFVYNPPQAPVAQLDRVLPSEGRGRTFESCRARHLNKSLSKCKASETPELRTAAARYKEASMQHLPTQFEDHAIRRVYDENTEIWWSSVVDIIQVLTQQPDFQTARKYWNKLKERLGKEGSQSVTDCHRLKLPAADGKNYLTDVATAETLLRLVHSVPSPKAEPIKL